MKKLIPILSVVCIGFLFQSCTNEDQETMTPFEEHQHILKDVPMTYSSKTDSTKSHNNQLYPDPPVKDTHDWRTQP